MLVGNHGQPSLAGRVWGMRSSFFWGLGFAGCWGHPGPQWHMGWPLLWSSVLISRAWPSGSRPELVLPGAATWMAWGPVPTSPLFAGPRESFLVHTEGRVSDNDTWGPQAWGPVFLTPGALCSLQPETLDSVPCLRQVSVPCGSTSQGRGASQADSRDVPVLGQLCLPPSALYWSSFMAVCGRRAGLITVSLLGSSGRAPPP